MSAPIRLGIIGGGRWGKNIIRTVIELKSKYPIDLQAVITSGNPANASAIGGQFGVSCRTDLTPFLDSRPDALIIASPDETHFSIAEQALSRGISTFVEKPVALSLSETERLIALSQQKRTLLTAGHILVFHPCVAFIQDWLKKNGQTPRAFYSSRLAQFALTGGKTVLKSSLIHDISMVDIFAGEIPASADVRQMFGRGDKAEYMDMMLNYAGGRTAHLVGSSSWPENSRTFVLWADDAFIHFDGVQNKIKIYRKNVFESEAAPTGQPLYNELENFIVSLSDSTRLKVTADHILRVMQTIDLIERRF